jgi:hypothetical protein
MQLLPPNPPTQGVGLAQWLRSAAIAINGLLTPTKGQVRYVSGQLQYWDGTQWANVP